MPYGYCLIIVNNECHLCRTRTDQGPAHFAQKPGTEKHGRDPGQDRRDGRPARVGNTVGHRGPRHARGGRSGDASRAGARDRLPNSGGN